MEALLHSVAHYIALAVEAIAIAIVAIGSARALAGIVRIALSPSGQREPGSRAVALEYGHWLIAGLTFQLAAVAAIRTFLSYFLDIEMERAGRRAIGGTP